MGFWSPHSLVQDARRHGVRCARPTSTPRGRRPRSSRDRRSTGGARCGWASSRCGASARSWRRRSRPRVNGPYVSPEDLVRRVPALTLAQLEAIATAGAFGECFGLDRREALWAVGRRVAVPARPAAGHRDRRRRADAARHDAGRGVGRRPVGHRRVARRPPHAVPARRARRARASSRRSGLWEREPASRVLVGGRGHPPPAADDRPGRDLPQPRGRDRADQRRRVARAAGRVTARSPAARRRC